METNYLKQANDFLTQTNSTIEIKFIKTGKHFVDDKEDRDIYSVLLKRGGRSYKFNFGQSLSKSGVKVQKGGRIIPVPLPEKLVHLRDRNNSRELWGYIRQNILFRFEKVIYPTEPNCYDILACLQKYDVGTFSDFCSNFGYCEDSRKAELIYNDVCKEFSKLQSLYNDEELELLAEIY